MKNWDTDPAGALRISISECVEEAKTKIVANDGIEPMVVLEGAGESISIDVGCTPTVITAAVVRDLCASHPKLELAFHISMAYTLRLDAELRDGMSIAEHPDARLCVIIHGNHRDAGLIGAHIPFKRLGPKQFEFGDVEWPDPAELERTSALTQLWGKRHLNS